MYLLCIDIPLRKKKHKEQQIAKTPIFPKEKEKKTSYAQIHIQYVCATSMELHLFGKTIIRMGKVHVFIRGFHDRNK